MTAEIQRRLPPWFKVRFPGGDNYVKLKRLVRQEKLHTICEEARCPNMGECWEYGTATFLILGDVCTRACAYCAVTSGRPHGLDLGEPQRVAGAVHTLGLRHAVVTLVNRGDLPAGRRRLLASHLPPTLSPPPALWHRRRPGAAPSRVPAPANRPRTGRWRRWR